MNTLRAIILAFLFCTFPSCQNNKKQQEDREDKIEFLFDGDPEVERAEELAFTIENSYNNNYADSIHDVVSTVLMSNRIEDYKKFPKEERRYMLGVIKGMINERILSDIQELQELGFKHKLISVNKQENGFTAVYELVKIETNMVWNYMILTLEKDKYDVLKIADFYNIEKGYSMTDYLNLYMNEQEFRRMNLISAKQAEDRNNSKLEAARRQLVFENYQQAYDYYKSIDSAYVVKNGIGHEVLVPAMQLSPELALKEYKFLSKIVPKALSVEYYKCRILDLTSSDEDEALDCYKSFTDLLISY